MVAYRGYTTSAKESAVLSNCRSAASFISVDLKRCELGQEYLEYFKVSEDKFFNIIENFRNKKIFNKINDKWILKDEN